MPGTSPHSSGTSDRRGTVLMLVVACLVLMVVMATVYLVAARTDRGNVRAVNATVDLDQATEAALNTIRNVVHEAGVDSKGNVLGMDAGGPSKKRARYYDYPETGLPVGTSAADASTPDQPWLVLPGDPPGFRFTRFVARDPAGNWSLNRYNPSNNAADLPAPGQAETPVMDPTGAADSAWYLLSYTSSQNLRFRFATRIIDNSAMANLNVGTVDSGQIDPHGQYLSGYQIFALAGAADAAKASLLHVNAAHPKGRGGGSFGQPPYTFGLFDWNSLLLTYEMPHSLDGNHFRAISPVEFFDCSEELEIRAKDPRRPRFMARPIQLWPNTLAQAAATRDQLSAYSFDRNTAPVCPATATFKPYTISNGVNSGVVWPPYPARVNLNSYLPPMPLWEGNRTYLAGEVVTGQDGNAWLCTVSHFGYPEYASAPSPVAPPWHVVKQGDAPTLSGYAPTSPGVSHKSSAFWNYTPLWVAGLEWFPGQRCRYGGNVYICRYPITSAPAINSAPDQTATPATAGGAYYWRKMPPSTDPLYRREEVLAATAANLASAMKLASAGASTPYTDEEVRAFAVNYITYRYGSGRIAANGLYALPMGPAFMDDKGICVRGGLWKGNAFTAGNADFASPLAFTSPSNFELRSEVQGKRYFGYAAQPFINEVVFQCDASGALVDAGIELVNPHNVPLDFQTPGAPAANWKFVVYPKVGSATTIDLGALFDNTGTSVGIPAGGIVAVSDSAAPGTPLNLRATANGCSPDFARMVANLAAAMGSNGGTIHLTRPYVPRGAVNFSAGAADAVVDSFDYPPFSAAANAERSTQRPNAGGAGLFMAAWACSATSTGTLDPTAPAPTNTFGAANGAPATTPALPAKVPNIVLYDRFCVPGGFAPDVNFGFLNLADFNRIMRVTNTTDVASASPGGVDAKTLSRRFGLCNTPDNDPALGLFVRKDPGTGNDLPPMPASAFPYEASIRFDFRAVPAAYSDPPDTAGMGDPRAVRLLDSIAAIDRAGDVIDVGGGIGDVNKVRVPGRININGAHPDVIKAVSIANMTQQMVANVITFRERMSVPFTYGSATGFDFMNPPPGTPPSAGKGVRSLAEFYFVCAPNQVAAGNPTTMYERDLPWARVANLVTTRSDAFTVHLCLEALRMRNPQTHNNASDWYGGSTDDPLDTSVPNTLVARRRLMAIIDRSYCNGARGTATFALPRVVGTRELPP